jgi:glycosyltransferase involved in cell wall biosynthesis
MSIAIVSVGPEPGLTDELARTLHAAGRRVHVEEHPGAGVGDVGRLGHRLATDWAAAAPDVVLAHGWQAGLAAQVATRGEGVPVVQRLLGLTRRHLDPESARLEAAVARSADLVLAACAGEADELVSLGVRRSRVRVVPYGVDVDTFSDAGVVPEPATGHRLVSLLPRADETGRVAMAGLGALVGMLPGLAGCELVLLRGSGAEDAGDLPALAERHRVADRVRVVGPLPPAQLAELLRSVDAAVLTSDDPAGATFVLKVMACGRPVVAAAGGATGDAVADAVTGVLVPTGSWERLGEAVRGLLSDPVRRDSLGLAAVDRARARFNWELVAAATARTLDEAAGTAQQAADAAS